MFRERPHPAFIAGAVAFSLITFAAGAATAAITAGDVARGEPIIKADAWAEQPPEMIVQAAFSEATTMAQCSPWEVSDVAMEEILLEMQRRGWRAPNQGEAIALLDPTGELSITALDPNAPMPRRYSGQTDVTAEETTAELVSAEGVSLVAPESVEPLPPTN